MTKPHLAIGFLVDRQWGVGGYQSLVSGGIAEVARLHGITLVSFTGEPLQPPGSGTEHLRNDTYDLASVDSLDGLVVSSATLSSYAGPDAIRYLLDRYRPLPMVSIGLAVEGVPSIVVDNAAGLRDAITHLIRDHGLRRIAFIRGPDHNPEAHTRYRTYTEVLAEHDLSLSPDLVASGDFMNPSGIAAARVLLDERKLRPKTDIEAIVAANDYMAIGALEELQARGIHVPYDVAIVGFDDVGEARAATPSLTTVRQPAYEIGKESIEMLLAILNGQEVTQLNLPTQLVLRQSCGCAGAVPPQSADEPEPLQVTGVPLPIALAARRKQILSEMILALSVPATATGAAWAAQLLDAFPNELEGGQPSTFLTSLAASIRQSLEIETVTFHWHEMLSAMRSQVRPLISTDDTLASAEELWQRAQILAGRIARQDQSQQKLQMSQRASTLNDISQRLTTTFDASGLMDIAAQEIPRLGIPSCYIVTYESTTHPTDPTAALPERSRLVMAYEEGRRIELGQEGRPFATRQLLPDGLLSSKGPRHLIAKPLYFRDERLGFVLFEAGPPEDFIYETLRAQISNAMKSARLFQQVENRALQLQTAAEVSRAASSILDPESLIQQAVDLARERFDLYYAGLFLVDQSGEWTGQPRRWAVLRAGTGDPGRQMLARGHRLEIGGESMIGQCVAHKQARIALDVGEEAVRFDNPFLPKTRSELALPLVSRGEAIGALTIQSAQEAAFTQEDIAVLQTMADQLANAIANARLYDQAQQEIAERKRAEEALAKQAQTLDAELEQIFYVASHHLQEPLRMVVSYSQLLQQRHSEKLDAEADEFMSYAVNGAVRIQTLINDMLAYSRIGTRASHLTPIDSAAVLGRSLSYMKFLVEESGAVITYDPLPTIVADEVQLTQLFQNLIGNAIKFRSERRPEIHVKAERRGDDWLFSIQDNGIGIAPQHFERIFRIFHRLHSEAEYPGTGIGLAVCKKIVERHGGRIWVESQPGQGSTFYFTLPVARDVPI